MTKQRKHIRRSTRGKRFIAGRGFPKRRLKRNPQKDYRQIFGPDKFNAVEIDPDARRFFIHDKNEDLRLAIAEITEDPELLRILAKDPDEEVRNAVAFNTDDEDILNSLARDSSTMVKTHVASKTHDPKILFALAKDPDWEVRTEVAENENTPRDVLLDMAKDEDPDIKRIVRRLLPRDIVRDIEEDESKNLATDENDIRMQIEKDLMNGVR